MAELTQFGVEFQVEGIVKAQESFDKLAESGGRASTSIDRFSGAAQKQVGVAAALGSAVGSLASNLGLKLVDFFKDAAFQALTFAAELNNLAKTTSMTVEELSIINDIARQSGTSLEQLGGSITKLQRAMYDARGGAKDLGVAFAQMGIDVTDGSLNTAKMLDLVASRLLQMEDGVTKNNIAMQLFGKTGTQLNEFLSDYATRTQTAARVSTEMAENNEKLIRGWTALKNSIMDAVEAVAQWVLKGAGKLYNMNAQDELNQVLERQRKLRDEIQRLESGGGGVYEQMYATEKVAGYRAELEQLNKQQLELNKQLGIIKYEASDADQNTRKLFQGIKLGGEDTNKTTDKLKLMTGEIKRIAEFKGFTSLEKNPFFEQFRKDFDRTLAAMEKFTDDYEEWLRDVTDPQPKEIRQLERFREELLKLKENFVGTGEDLILINYWLDEWIPKTMDLVKYNAQIKENVEGTAKAAQDASEHTNRMWETLKQDADQFSNDLADAIMRGFESGEGFAKSFLSDLKQMFNRTILQPIIKAVMAPVGNWMAAGVNQLLPFQSGGFSSAGLSGSGMGMALSNVFGASDFTAAIAGDAMLPGALASGGLSGMGAFGAGLASPFSTIGAGFSGMMSGGLSGGLAAMGGVAGALGAALPVALIGLALYSMFKKPRGAPKTGGFASDIPGLDRFFTPNQSDSDMRTLVNTTADAFGQTLTRLGGTGSGLFAFGYDEDPKGTAGSRISAQATINGQSVFSLTNLDVGRGEGAVQAALEDASKQAVLAALQASDLPAAIKAVLMTVDAASATSEEVDKILNLAGAFKDLTDVISGDLGEDVAQAVKEAGMSAFDAFHNSSEGLYELVEAFDGTLETTQELTQATGAYRQAGIALLVQIEQLRTALTGPEGLFANLIRDLTFQTLNPQQQYDFLISQSGVLEEQLRAAKDPARINALAQQLEEIYRQAFGMLSPEQQRASLGEYISNIEALSTSVNERLDAARDDVQSALQGALDTITNKLDLVVADMGKSAQAQVDAAGAQVTAAQTQLAAANTPIQVRVNLDGAFASNVNGG